MTLATTTPLPDGVMRTSGSLPAPAGDRSPGEDPTQEIEAHQEAQGSGMCPVFAMRNPTLDLGIMREISR